MHVYAVERKPEAVELLRKNREHFHMDNMEIIEALAPEGLEELPALDPVKLEDFKAEAEEEVQLRLDV